MTATTKINFEAIPFELKLLPQWVCWRRETRGGELTKPPYRADGVGMASTTNRDTWASFEAAINAFSHGGYDGIGFVFSPNDPYTGVDLDKCRNPESGMIDQWAQDIIHPLNSYSEVTPSGKGVHVIIKAKLPPGGNKKGNIEMYDAGRYFTITGHLLEGTANTIETRQEELNQLHAQVFPKTEPVGKPGGNGSHPPVDLSDTELIAKAENAKNGAAFRALWRGDTSTYGGDDSAADMALCCHLAFRAGNDPARIDRLFRQSGLYRAKWEREDYRVRTITKAIEGTGETYTPEHARQPSTTHGEANLATKPSVTLENVLSRFTTYYHLPDTGHIEIMLAAIAANLGDGDPVWLLIVAPPGWGKTEPINAVSHLPHMFPVAVLTEASLLSGTPKKDRAQEAKGGLLAEMGDFGILLVKDFSGMLTMQKDSRGPILSALREVYDGAWTRYIGAEGGRKLHWEGKCGLIGAATPSIDQHYAVMAILGERFNYYRIPEEEETGRAEKALKYAGQEKNIRAELRDIVGDFFAGLKPSNELPILSEDENKRLIALASFATRCRSAVERENYQSREILF